MQFPPVQVRTEGTKSTRSWGRVATTRTGTDRRCQARAGRRAASAMRASPTTANTRYLAKFS